MSNFLTCTFRWHFVAMGFYNHPRSVQGEKSVDVGCKVSFEFWSFWSTLD